MIAREIINKIRHMIWKTMIRGYVRLVTANLQKQFLEVQFCGTNALRDVEKLEHYGFSYYPPAGSTNNETMIFNPGGNLQNAVALGVYNKTFRPIDLLPGEVRLYAKDTAGTVLNKISIKADNSITIQNFAGGKITVNAAGQVLLNQGTDFVIKGTTAQPEMVKDQALMQALQAAISAWAPVPNDGGAALKTALAAFLALPQADYSAINSTTVKTS